MDSPFIAHVSADAAPETASDLELHGVYSDGSGKCLFNLFEVDSRHALWVELKEPGNPFTVHIYDRSREVVTVEYRGRILSLSLKRSKVIASAPAISRANEIKRMAKFVNDLRIRNEATQRWWPKVKVLPPSDKPASAPGGK
ncbi:MAG: hypothetical protein WC378_17590 [Opitutaceae bacterium]